MQLTTLRQLSRIKNGRKRPARTRVRQNELARRYDDQTRSSSEGQAVSFVSSSSARACLNDWNRALAVKDLLNLLLALRRALATAGDPVILLLVVRESVPNPADYFLECLQATLPAILDCCEQLVIVVEGGDIDRAPFRAAFQTTRRTTKQARPQVFNSLSTAFAYVQPHAPHDVLELQRQVMRLSFPPRERP